METNQVINIGAFVAIIAFLWRLHMDIAGVKERLARIEGWIEGRFKDTMSPENSQS